MDGIIRINVGCGQNPIKGWRNFDNSLSVRLAMLPFLAELLAKIRMLNTAQYDFIRFARSHLIEYGDVAKGLPLLNGCADVLYSSHMLEHLDRSEAAVFLKEARRVLRSGGIIRLAVPDIRKQIQQYMESGDADSFIAATRLCQERPRTGSQRLRVLLVGPRNHQWMYDGVSLCRLLSMHGFIDPTIMQLDETNIQNPGPLDLRERLSESVYVEALNP